MSSSTGKTQSYTENLSMQHASAVRHTGQLICANNTHRHLTPKRF